MQNDLKASRLFQFAVVAAGIISAVAAFFALKEPGPVIATGAVSGVIFGAFAGFAFWRKERLVGGSFVVVSLLVVAGTIYYGSLLARPAAGDQGTGAINPPATTQQQNPPAPDSKPSLLKPVYQGTAKIVPGQVIDLETASPVARDANTLESGDDFRIDGLTSFVSDRDGYILSYTGEINDGKAGCTAQLKSRKNLALFALPNQWYCARTSEGRIALLQFGAGATYSRVGSVSYRVWDE